MPIGELPITHQPKTADVITLTLLHPLQDTAVQNWTFEKEPVIRIGRSTDNNVILYSAVVSRHHLELRREADSKWELRNLGTNGTYLDGKRVNQVSVVDGTVIRLARSGPKIKISIGAKKGTKPHLWQHLQNEEEQIMRPETKKAPQETCDPQQTWVPLDDQPSTRPDLGQD